MPPLHLSDKFPNLQGSTQDQTDFDLYKYIHNSWAVIFLHPGDFTPVCSTELGKAAELHCYFKNRGVKLVGFSCNDASSHRQWIRDIEHLSGHAIEFPIFCDPTREYAEQLGVLDACNKDKAGLPLTVRGTYILKPDHSVCVSMAYPHSAGRNLDELLRLVDAVMMTETHSVFTPANWQPGQECMVDLHLTDKEAKERHGEDAVRIVDMPSEHREQGSHYLRFTRDPVDRSSKKEDIMPF